MNEDKLAQAIHSLRHYGELSNASEIVHDRERILNSLRTEKRPTNKRWATFWIPLAAVLAGSTAWAAASGQLPKVWKIITHPFKSEPTTLVQVNSNPSTLLVRSTSVVPSTPKKSLSEEPSIPLVETQPETLSQPQSSVSVTPTVSIPIPTQKILQPTPIATNPTPVSSENTVTEESKSDNNVPVAVQESENLSLYKKAHELHFNQKNYAAALHAWNDYLQNMPTGVFVTEARYNRAICLVRLGRYVESKAALQPFASGSMGGYRQKEAQELLDTVNKKSIER